MNVKETLIKAIPGSQSFAERMMLPFGTVGRGALSILPIQSTLAPLLATITSGNQGIGNSWLFLLIFTWFSGVFATLSKVVSPLDYLLAYTYIDSIHENGDLTYKWLLHYWQNHPSYEQSRSFVTEAGNGIRNTPDRQAHTARRRSGRKTRGLPSAAQDDDALDLRYRPKDTEAFWFWRGWTLFRMTHTVREVPRFLGASPEKMGTIAVRCFAFRRGPLVALLRDAKELYTNLLPSMLSIHVYDPDSDWWLLAAVKPKRPLSSIRMVEADKGRILIDAKDFFSSEQWYVARGIPWRRGYMLHGSPGTGKTSTIHALASELDLPVYVLPLSSDSLSDYTLSCAVRSIPDKSILVLEDIDVATKSMTRDLETVAADKSYIRASKRGSRPPNTAGLSLSALLNCIDGMDSSEGRLLVMTSNDLASLDPALIRPGRCDLFFEYRKATREQATHLFRSFYADLDSIPQGDSPEGSNTHEPQTGLEDLSALWASHLGEHEFSMASLQGMLLQHKKDPHSAVREVESWVKAERESLTLKKRQYDATVELDAPVHEEEEATVL